MEVITSVPPPRPLIDALHQGCNILRRGLLQQTRIEAFQSSPDG